MPLYEYICKKCSETFELLQKMGEAPPATCESCQAKGTLEKKISVTSFQLKGGGWYNEGYSSKKPPEKEGSADSAKTSDEKPKPSTPEKTTAPKKEKKDSPAPTD